MSSLFVLTCGRTASLVFAGRGLLCLRNTITAFHLPPSCGNPNVVGLGAVTAYAVTQGQRSGQRRGGQHHHNTRHRSSQSHSQPPAQPRPQVVIPPQNNRVQFTSSQPDSASRSQQQQQIRQQTSNPAFRSPDSPMGRRHQVLFYHRHQPHYGFTNFSAHPVIYGKKTYPTSEHLFQAFKFMKNRPDIAEHIRTVSSNPRDAFDTARKYKHDVRPDWLQVNIKKMEEVVFAKFTQHADLCNELLDTGDAELVEDSDRDSFWGWGADRKGRNELGKALMKLRSQLREHPPFSPRE